VPAVAVIRKRLVLSSLIGLKGT